MTLIALIFTDKAMSWAYPNSCGTGTLACASLHLEDDSTGRSACATRAWVKPQAWPDQTGRIRNHLSVKISVINAISGKVFGGSPHLQ
jgi:hypothetical protein